MVFKNQQEAATLLAQKIKSELNFVETHHDASLLTFAYINPESKNFAELVAKCLSLTASLLSDPNQFVISNLKLLIILDNGSTNAIEYNEFTDKIRKNNPTTKIILAIPVIPEAEKVTLESVCDTLIYLHSDPYFFSVSQFFPVK